jgi:hypothetical protein
VRHSRPPARASIHTAIEKIRIATMAQDDASGGQGETSKHASDWEHRGSGRGWRPRPFGYKIIRHDQGEGARRRWRIVGEDRS